ncbi:MAG: RtcB family protein [archaeon]
MEMRKIRDSVHEIKKEGAMRVPARLYANDSVRSLIEESALIQGMNVATMPGIQRHSIMLPDTHYGYGFPIGGVAAFFEEEGGVISPGGIGYDQNCGVRMITTTLTADEVKPKLRELVDALFKNVPSGVGSESDKVRAKDSEIDDVARLGAKWAIEHGYGEKEDLSRTEENGCMENTDPSKVSDKAKKRGRPQLGTLGSGNHFLEIQKVSDIFEEKTAKKFGITGKDQVIIMLHCGSRGYGYQICDDYISRFNSAMPKWKIELPDRELVCAPLGSDEANDFVGALNCGINYAFCNRQVMTHWIRETMMSVFRKEREELGLDLIYDVCHNVAKFEEHEVDGERRVLCVHRKGATRAMPAGRKEIPKLYRKEGQPVLIPGDMGSASYVMVGTESASETFFSTAHGAGRLSSRTHALKTIRGEDVQKKLEARGQIVRATSFKVIAEEAPGVYKNIDDVIASTESAGISRKVARMTPMGVTKG